LININKILSSIEHKYMSDIDTWSKSKYRCIIYCYCY